MKLTEDLAKAWLRGRGLPVPEGAAAASGGEAARIAGELAGPVAIKALVPTGRRGKAGAVRFAEEGKGAAKVADELIGRTVGGFEVKRVYVEKRVDIASELYLSFAFGPRLPRLVVSRKGGVDIEETFANDPGAIISEDVDILRGLRPWDAVALWERAGVTGAPLARLGRLTADLYAAFQAADGLMLELNPLALDARNAPHLVGAMLEVDDNALYRHPDWEALATEEGQALHPLTERERQVIEADKKFPGGAVRYTELEGDIGLLVAGGGAGLVQHDLIVNLGEQPANHTDISPGPTPEKLVAVLEAVFSNPRTRSLLIGYNHLQMAPCDFIVEALITAIGNRKVDPRRFPIVLRVFGPKEEEARALAATVPGLHYLPAGATLEDGVRKVVELKNEAGKEAAAG